jgi:hypothetical protein
MIDVVIQSGERIAPLGIRSLLERPAGVRIVADIDVIGACAYSTLHPADASVIDAGFPHQTARSAAGTVFAFPCLLYPPDRWDAAPPLGSVVGTMAIPPNWDWLSRHHSRLANSPLTVTSYNEPNALVETIAIPPKGGLAVTPSYTTGQLPLEQWQQPRHLEPLRC